MKERKEIVMTVFHQGAVIVNDATILRDYGDCLLVSVDLKSKYAETGATASGNMCGPQVFLDANENTLFLDESKDRNEHTVIEFPEYVGWSVFSCSQPGRYTITITLVSRTAFDPRK